MKNTKNVMTKKLSLKKKTITVLESPQHVLAGSPPTKGIHCITDAPTCGESCITFRPNEEQCIFC